jgi:hypothetical protein
MPSFVDGATDATTWSAPPAGSPYRGVMRVTARGGPVRRKI